MKPNKTYISLVIGAGVLFITASSLSAQDCQCPEETAYTQNEPASELTFIGEKDYPAFLNIHNLKKYSNIIYDGENFHSSRVRKYTLTSNGNRIQLTANYAKDGSLTDGSLVIKDGYLPQNIRLYLIGNGLKGWVMTSNRIYVKDFDANTTEYEVEMRKGDLKQILYFDRSGKRSERLAHSYK